MTASIVLSGCLSTGFNYVTHHNPDKTAAFYRLPAHWKVYDYAEVLRAANGPLSLSTLSEMQGAEWLDAFSADPRFKASEFAFIGTKYPAGIASAFPIAPNARGSFSISELRSLILGSDPFAVHSPFGVMAYSEFTGSDGLRGIKMVVSIPISGLKTSEFGEVAEVDAATNWVFEIGLGCSIGCWTTNSGVIHQVLNSWLVKER
jgi:hypothetical protein